MTANPTSIDPRTDMQGWNRQQYLDELRELAGKVRKYPAHYSKGCLKAGDDVYAAIQELIKNADSVKF